MVPPTSEREEGRLEPNFSLSPSRAKLSSAAEECTKDTRLLLRAVSQVPAHHAKPSPNDMKGWIQTNKTIQKAKDHKGIRGILPDQTDLTKTARKTPREEADTNDDSTACNPAGRYFPRTKSSLTVKPEVEHQPRQHHAWPP